MTKFLTKTEFTKQVEKYVFDKKMNYLEAVIKACDEYQIDPEDVKKFISTSIQEKIEAEAMNLNLIPRSGVLNFD